MLVAILAAAATAFGCGGLLRTILLVPVSTLVLHPPSARDQFFNLVATDFKQPALCNRIDWRADASIRGWDTPHRIRTMRSACRSNLELPPNADFFSGAGDNAGVRGPGARARIHGCGRAQAAHTAGYPATPIYAVYRGLLSNDEFRSRLRAASDYGEARNRARLRPARPIEFMYQMVAVDASEAALCSKISPNATFDDEGSPLALLQSRCYLHIAFNTRDIRSCDPLPAAGSFPHINEIYDSRERCRKTVAIYSRPDFTGNPLYGSTPFPRAADFEAILLERSDTRQTRCRGCPSRRRMTIGDSWSG